jgi:hypothetical protein
METAVATTAHATAAAEDVTPFPLRDVEDLHDADLAGVLSDRLLDADVATASATAVAGLVGRPGAAALFVHTLSARALLLAVV